MPALTTEKFTQPRVDIDVWGHPGLARLRIDFTAISADSSRGTRATDDPTAAAVVAEQAKVAKYGFGPQGAQESSV